ncbi:MAG TPA: SRPBCC family protein [Candidatus Dormibacteraeota bacterium]
MASTSVAGIDVVAAPNTQEVIITRTFQASRERVFKVYTDPARIPKWWGPARLTTVVETMEVRPGGRWRHVQSEADGTEYAFHGVYHDVVAPERLVNTFEYEGAPGQVSLDCTTFAETGGTTTVSIHSVFPSVGARDAMLQEGMTDGLAESMRRIDDLLAGS